MRGAARLGGWFAVAMWVLSPDALAEPLVRVRAESRIELGVTQRRGAALISGALRDELGEPLSGRTMALQATPLAPAGTPLRRTLVTDEQGRFEMVIDALRTDYALLASFAGDATHRGVRVERMLERHRADVRLELRVPHGGVLDVDRDEPVQVDIIAESDAGGTGIQMRLSNELGQTLATGRTDGEGRLRLLVDPARLGPAGPGLLRIESAADARHAEAQTETRIVRRRSLRLTLHASQTSFEAGEPIELTGRVHARRRPQPGTPVGLFADGEHAGTVVSDEHGRFRAKLWLNADPGPLRLIARIEGDAVHPSTEASVQVDIGPAAPLPWSWLLGALGAVAAAGLWASRERLQDVTRGAELSAEEGMVSHVERAPRQTRRPDRRAISGRATDLRDGRAVRGAEVMLRLGERTIAATRTDKAGRFTLDAGEVGALQLVVRADGFVPTVAALQVPHRGEWTDFEVHLESLRVRALAPFRRIALRVLPSARSWGVWTDREVLRWMRRRAGREDPALAALTHEVERACYAEPGPTEAQVREIEARARAVEASLPPQPGS